VSAKHVGIIKNVPGCGRPQGPLPLCLRQQVSHLTDPRSPSLRPLWTAPIKLNICYKTVQRQG